ncbi:glycosyltransferase [Sinorhizobium meliloti]|jgi:glycosyltransferase involved in cell wall biosynthesis|uniref:glycosyltransferase n=1 Tax=Rhizobium meliloti TaxID=382 RepID=UPI0020BDC16B|nr:glycosyltransferase [Sinorhizobium meliloti]
MTSKTILFVSDSLGTPIHARGIFNFSYGIVQILSDLGFKVHLLVEPPAAVVNSRMSGEKADLSSVEASALLTDIFRHFQGERFRFDWFYQDSAFQRLCDESKDLAEIELTIADSKRVAHQKQILVDDEVISEYINGSQTDHLALFDGMLVSEAVYSESFRRAIHKLRPNIVDASGYDFVFVDTPHALDFANVDSSKIVFVVHDLIPLFEVTMGYDWREMFVNKLSATAREGRNGIFVSETTRSYFKKFYGSLRLNTSTIVFPPVRKEVVENASAIGRKPTSNYIREIESNKEAEFAQYVHEQSGNSAEGRRSLFGRGNASASANGKWNGSLPYFCSVLSDEPRKNIKVLVEASRKLIGRANIVVMGQIDGNAHMEGRPDLYPNLHFTGYVSDVQKFDLLSACEAFIFPSFSEGFGIPIIEAALFGAPIICSDIPVFREVTNGLASFFNPSSADELVERINVFLRGRSARDDGQQLRQFAIQQFVQASLKGRLAEVLQQVG